MHVSPPLVIWNDDSLMNVFISPLRIPGDSLGSLLDLQFVNLAGNQLTGTFPPSICQLGMYSQISDIVISNNQINGTLDISNCTNLFFFDASVSICW